MLSWMHRFAAILSVLAVLLVIPASPSDDEDSTPPIEVDKTERAEVRLVLLDTVVVDAAGDPVAGLERDDFELRIKGEAFSPAILETRCELPGDEPLEAQAAVQRTEPRRIVLLFDYLHLPMLAREESLATAMRMVKEGIAEDDEVMIAALTGGLRVEQPFTSDKRDVLSSLKRMRKDVSLWNGNFYHSSETGFVRGITSLFDVLASASTGPKAVVLYSAMQDVPLDFEFERIAAIAAVSRSALYTVDPRGLLPGDLEMDRPAGRPG
jgi:VWFA-related protein